MFFSEAAMEEFVETVSDRIAERAAEKVIPGVCQASCRIFLTEPCRIEQISTGRMSLERSPVPSPFSKVFQGSGRQIAGSAMSGYSGSTALGYGS